jgi:putative ABC transport system permease protein
MLFARREIRRSLLRFGLLSGAVGLLVFLILFQQLLLGSLLQSFTGAIERQSADVLVYGAEARRNVAGSIVLPGTVDEIAVVEGVVAAEPLGESTVTVEAVDATGTSAQLDASVFGWVPGGPGEPTDVVEGRLPDAAGEAVASSEDRADGFDIGDSVTVVPGGTELTVVGLTSGSRFSVAPTLFVDYPTYEQVRLAQNSEATTVFPSLVAVAVADGDDPVTVAATITEQVPGVEALTRSQAVSDAPGVSQVQTSFFLILGLAFVVVGLVLAFFFVILTVQKRSSVALMRAVGMSAPRLVSGLYLQIGFVVAIGVALGVGLVLAATSGGGGSGGLPIEVDPVAMSVSVGIIVGVSLLGSLFSVLRVVRVDPQDAVSRPGLGGLS